MPKLPASAAFLCLALAACRPGAEGGTGGSAIADRPASVFAGIAPDETIRFLGTEPFWSGEIAGTRLTYATPEKQAGETIAVRRFAGNNGLSFSGVLRGAAFDLAITPGACSDGMSDRRFPYIVTLSIGGDQRSGCAWTSRQPFTETSPP
ncbi:COG3650 family protein [Qipengyuania sediminis]|uniref:COG3650 family protein n=1 Tax=Qipengyuania sediminis TaxID=1532023 RepID=UPI00105A1568|nr:hypothetical protein [Qipengyuania sediminis]